ncbi:B3 domain-containing protein Os01g0723500-like [Papaver somniferum]|uniref:B3 domain-containing protein Os01g0723500-like n=1 Tax=Papaver somniferum TaxID=3469 RepID=UPI000E705CAB|nr:B3 domain-containing protein Os01g0723500-like [Papaver somniferum]
MKVPVEFLEQLTCEIPKIFSLRGPSGKVWRVRLLEMGDGYYFENGWQDFVIDNFVSDQDICVFKYVNENWLQVQIFEQNGCEKESAFEANCSQTSTTNCSAGRWGEKAVKNQGKFPIFKGRASTMNRSARCWGKKAVKNQGERLGGPLISQRRDITAEEENMALDAALGFVSRNPYTVITMRNSHVYTGYCLPLPRSFCNEHLPDRSQDMTLRDPRGEVWGVRFYFFMNETQQIGQLTTGWRKVSFTNNIEASDVCILELVKPDEFQLHIFRVVEEITPLKRQRDI